MDIRYHRIGTVRSPFQRLEDMPIQPAGAAGVVGQVEVLPDYVEGLQDLEGFSHIILLYHFHLVRESSLVITPFLDDRPHGVFATRAPKRPNPIGISTVRLVRINTNVLEIENVDILDGTPLLDIKPYVPAFDQYDAERIGWLKGLVDRLPHTTSDSRFVD
jgi:tRNA-Thr(GGU) m(6)t(6)A37 methyltransferase TsaA